MAVRGERPMGKHWHCTSKSRVIIAVAILILMGCVLAFLYPNRFFVSIAASTRDINLAESKTQVGSIACESSERINLLKSEFASVLSEENGELKKQVRELTERLQQAQRHILGLDGHTHQEAVELYGTEKGVRTDLVPDEAINPRLANILKKVAICRELIVAIANSKVKDILEIWFTNIKRVGIPNFLVVALDKETADFCETNNVPVYSIDSDEATESISRSGTGAAVSGLKFDILREFLRLGYSVLLSDVDIVFLQNPFDHLYRDSDVESMSDGHNNKTSYGFQEPYIDPTNGWSAVVHTYRIWVYNSGFFYLRPTKHALELLDRVTARLSNDRGLWDQDVFNEELFLPSFPGYDGLHASKRTMDLFLFMNSNVLFKTVRRHSELRKLMPVVIHVNYHMDKLPRMKAIVEYYVNGNEDALKPFTDGTRVWYEGGMDMYLF